MKGIGAKLFAMIASLLVFQHANAWQYDDDINYVQISGTACRGQDSNAEQNLRHFPGSTSAVLSVGTVRVFCPLNRRNLHAYDKRLANFRDVLIHSVFVKVDSPSGNLRCRLFAKDSDSFSREVHYGEWHNPPNTASSTTTSHDFIWFNYRPARLFESINWGLMCDIPGGEAIRSVFLSVANNQ